MQVEGLALVIILLLSAKVHETENMSINPASADLVTTRLREICPSETGQEWSDHHNGATQFGTARNKIHTHYIVSIDLVGLEGIDALLATGHLDTHALKKKNQILHIQDLRNVGNSHLLLSQKHSADNLQRLILCSLRGNLSMESMSSLYYK